MFLTMGKLIPASELALRQAALSLAHHWARRPAHDGSHWWLWRTTCPAGGGVGAILGAVKLWLPRPYQVTIIIPY